MHYKDISIVPTPFLTPGISQICALDGYASSKILIFSVPEQFWGAVEWLIFFNFLFLLIDCLQLVSVAGKTSGNKK